MLAQRAGDWNILQGASDQIEGALGANASVLCALRTDERLHTRPAFLPGKPHLELTQFPALRPTVPVFDGESTLSSGARSQGLSHGWAAFRLVLNTADLKHPPAGCLPAIRITWGVISFKTNPNPRAPPSRGSGVINRGGVRHPRGKSSPGDSNVQRKLKNH